MEVIKIFKKTYLKKRNLLFLLLIFLIGTITINTIDMVSSTDITISSDTVGGLKGAIESSNIGDTIHLKDGIYKGENNTNITINKSIAIKGLGSNVVFNGEGKNQFFIINSKALVSLKNLKLTYGYSKHKSGAIYANGGNLILNNCIFTNNQAKTSGGAIRCMVSDLTVNSCIFTNNQVGFTGGAIYSDWKSVLTLNNCSFTKNKAKTNGGAIRSDSKSIINNCTFISNQAKNRGGAISVSNSMSMNKCIFTNNQAKNIGGAISVGYPSNIDVNKKVKISNSKFKNNIAGKKYNALYNFKKWKITKKNVKITPKHDIKVKK